MSESRLQSVQREYDRLASEYDERWSGYLAGSIRETIRRLSLRPGDRLLDVGCGTGLLIERIRSEWPAVTPVGVDLSEEMLVRARGRLRGGVPLVLADAGRLPFATGSFDVVVSTSSLHYWPDPAEALAESARVLRRSGRLVLTDWCGDYLSCRLLHLYLRLTGQAHERTYRSTECIALLRQAGYREVVLDRYRLNWFWGLMTARATAEPVEFGAGPA